MNHLIASLAASWHGPKRMSRTKGARMTRSRPLTFIAGAAVIPLAALAAGCGGGSSSNNGATASTTPAPKTTVAPAAIRVANSHLGKILVDSRGHTLYLFKK